jgi:membrane protease YdiL (CAAX protease family)
VTLLSSSLRGTSAVEVPQPPHRETVASGGGIALGMLVVFVAAIVLRVVVAGVAGRDSATAGLVFGGVLFVAAAAAGMGTRLGVRAMVIGVAGAVLLCAPVVAVRVVAGVAPHRPAGNYAAWAVVVCAVALAEEAFLRGALYSRLEAIGGPWLAIVGAAACFAALHVPLYGWRAATFDLAVGVWLGVLRHVSGGWVAPGIAHAGADLAAWWLR